MRKSDFVHTTVKCKAAEAQASANFHIAVVFLSAVELPSLCQYEEDQVLLPG